MLLFTDYEGMTIGEIARPLSAQTMPRASRWGFGGTMMTHDSILRQQRIEVTKLFERKERQRRKEK